MSISLRLLQKAEAVAEMIQTELKDSFQGEPETKHTMDEFGALVANHHALVLLVNIGMKAHK